MSEEININLKTVMRDGRSVLKLECPDCKIFGTIDHDHLFGNVSILCSCGFHKTINLVNLLENAASQKRVMS